MITLDTEVVEGSTFVATCTFEDETGASTTPKTDIAWKVITLGGITLKSGTATAASTVAITVEGVSLPVDNYKSQPLRFVASTTYDSVNGNDMPLVDYADFTCVNIPGA